MEKFKSLFFKISFVMMLLMSTQYCFATETTPIIIRKDDTSEPTPTQTNRIVCLLPVSATINDIELAVSFESVVGDAIITITSDSTGIVFQEVVNTFSTVETIIPVNELSSGSYTLTISFGRTTLKGEFLME